MCDTVTRRHRESQIEQEGASKGINRTVTMIAEALGIELPYGGTPSERRWLLVSIIESRHISLGP